MSFMDTTGLVGAGGSSSEGGTKKPIVKLLVQNGLRDGSFKMSSHTT